MDQEARIRALELIAKELAGIVAREGGRPAAELATAHAGWRDQADANAGPHYASACEMLAGIVPQVE
jgi:hypothetical protein